MTKALSILGSTGSIGTQTLEVAAHCGYAVLALTANSNVALLETQARRFHPKLAVLADESAAADLRLRLRDTTVRVQGGAEAVLEAASLAEADTVVTALVGIAGLLPTLAAIDAGKRIALANKETLVCAGPLVMARAKARGVTIIPVDSEHSAIFQCLQGSVDRAEIKRILLTASGGPFFGKTREELREVTPAQALRHPNWTMGAKVTIDSASLMNKGLEFLEAMALFELPPEKITVLVHRESIIHSLVEFCDHAILAQLGTPDMRVPIQYAISWPNRVPGPATQLDLLTCPSLNFAAPDLLAFPSLALAMEAAKTGGCAPAILNGANEIAVARFLQGEIGFLDIPHIVEQSLAHIHSEKTLTLAAILDADAEARRFASGVAAQNLR